MLRKIAGVLLLMILRNVVLERRVREAVHLHLPLEKEKAEKGKVEKVLSLRDPMPVLRRRASEALVPREDLSRYAVKNGRSVVPANGETNANFGMLLHADSLPGVVARLETHVRFLTEPALFLLTKQINPRQDLLSDCQL